MLTALIILDGYGYSENIEGNAVAAANTPNLDKILKENPHSLISASGIDVGLPEGQMGNSEVGHLNLGAGRVIYQELTRITKAITDGEFYENPEFLASIEYAKSNKSSIHLMGLLSDGGVHSHQEHLYALLKLIKDMGVHEDVYIHCFLDGRDTAPASGVHYVEELEEKIKEIGTGSIATISGRYYAMDRDQRWERTKLAFNAMVSGVGKIAADPVEAVKTSYEDQINDEFVLPTVILNDYKPRAVIEENDSIIFFNFRPDRARQLTRALTEESFDDFNRERGYLKTHFTSMTQYDTTFENVHIAYKPQIISNTLGEIISREGHTQLRIAETEKYAHVTYFFNGGEEKKYQGEDRILVASPQIPTYDLKPEMSAYAVVEKAAKAIMENDYSLVVLNFANCDMVGHTGDFNATVKAVEAVDKCLGAVLTVIEEKDGYALITADHGNAEQMLDIESGEVFTAHSCNKVKCILLGKENVSLQDGVLSDIAPTILELLNIKKPEEMAGKSLLKKD